MTARPHPDGRKGGRTSVLDETDWSRHIQRHWREGVRGSLGAFVASLVLGVLPFVLLGFAVGNVVNPSGAPPVIILTFFILALASGIVVPLPQLPGVLQDIAPFSPFYCLGELAWHAAGVSTGALGEAVVLALYGATSSVWRSSPTARKSGAPSLAWCATPIFRRFGCI